MLSRFLPQSSDLIDGNLLDIIFIQRMLVGGILMEDHQIETMDKNCKFDQDFPH